MINSPKILRPFVLAKLIFAVSLLSNSSINGQVQTRLRDSGKEIASVEQIVIPGGQADLRTRVVVFQNANCWLDNIDPDLENFVSVEEVHIVGNMSSELSTFISKFPNLEHVSVEEPPVDIDLEKVLTPLSGSQSLRSLDISMVEVSYRDCTFLVEFKDLVELSCDVTFSSKELVAISEIPNLHSLKIGEVINREIVRPVRLASLKNLTIMNPSDLGCFDTLTPIATLKIWGSCQENEILKISRFDSLRSVDLSVESVEYVKHLSTLRNLETLKIAIEQKSVSKE